MNVWPLKKTAVVLQHHTRSVLVFILALTILNKVKYFKRFIFDTTHKGNQSLTSHTDADMQLRSQPRWRQSLCRTFDFLLDDGLRARQTQIVFSDISSHTTQSDILESDLWWRTESGSRLRSLSDTRWQKEETGWWLNLVLGQQTGASALRLLAVLWSSRH